MASQLVYHVDAITAYDYARTTYKSRAAGERGEFYLMQLDEATQVRLPLTLADMAESRALVAGDSYRTVALKTRMAVTRAPMSIMMAPATEHPIRNALVGRIENATRYPVGAEGMRAVFACLLRLSQPEPLSTPCAGGMFMPDYQDEAPPPAAASGTGAGGGAGAVSGGSMSAPSPPDTSAFEQLCDAVDRIESVSQMCHGAAKSGSGTWDPSMYIISFPTAAMVATAKREQTEAAEGGAEKARARASIPMPGMPAYFDPMLVGMRELNQIQLTTEERRGLAAEDVQRMETARSNASSEHEYARTHGTYVVHEYLSHFMPVTLHADKTIWDSAAPPVYAPGDARLIECMYRLMPAMEFRRDEQVFPIASAEQAQEAWADLAKKLPQHSAGITRVARRALAAQKAACAQLNATLWSQSLLLEEMENGNVQIDKKRDMVTAMSLALRFALQNARLTELHHMEQVGDIIGVDMSTLVKSGGATKTGTAGLLLHELVAAAVKQAKSLDTGGRGGGGGRAGGGGDRGSGGGGRGGGGGGNKSTRPHQQQQQQRQPQNGGGKGGGGKGGGKGGGGSPTKGLCHAWRDTGQCPNKDSGCRFAHPMGGQGHQKKRKGGN